MYLMASKHMQSFILKSGKSINDPPNESSANTNLKAFYNSQRYICNNKVLNIKLYIPHMNTVI